MAADLLSENRGDQGLEHRRRLWGMQPVKLSDHWGQAFICQSQLVKGLKILLRSEQPADMSLDR